jgi:catechol 2,3-dioxygenase-like lactoylglutathione lyase family enzyme
MSLRNNKIIGFIPTRNPEAARTFYEQTLGLKFIADDQFALVFHVGPDEATMLRVVRTPEFTPAAFTIFGWQVDDILTTVSELTANKVQFLRFGFLQQDDLGIWSAPGGAAVAWFHDPDGNTLSLSYHPK